MFKVLPLLVLAISYSSALFRVQDVVDFERSGSIDDREVEYFEEEGVVRVPLKAAIGKTQLRNMEVLIEPQPSFLDYVDTWEEAIEDIFNGKFFSRGPVPFVGATDPQINLVNYFNLIYLGDLYMGTAP